MLTTAEVNKLFDLLKDLHGKDKPRDKRTVAIWATVLEPWSYPQVRSAAIERSRENHYFPDPSELAIRLPQEPRQKSVQIVKGGTEDWRVSFQRRWMNGMISDGYPENVTEATKTGMASDEWWRLYGKQQLKDREWVGMLSEEQRIKLRDFVEGRA